MAQLAGHTPAGQLWLGLPATGSAGERHAPWRTARRLANDTSAGRCSAGRACQPTARTPTDSPQLGPADHAWPVSRTPGRRPRLGWPQSGWPVAAGWQSLLASRPLAGRPWRDVPTTPRLGGCGLACLRRLACLRCPAWPAAVSLTGRVRLAGCGLAGRPHFGWSAVRGLRAAACRLGWLTGCGRLAGCCSVS
jgi:hypothetical protein